MKKIKLTFSNGDILEISKEQLIVPIFKNEDQGSIFASMGQPVEMCLHIQDGLIPSMLDMLYTCSYFTLPDKTNKIYSVSAIVSIERI